VAISFPVLYVFKIDKTIKKETQRLEHCHMLFSPGFSMKHTAGDIYWKRPMTKSWLGKPDEQTENFLYHRKIPKLY